MWFKPKTKQTDPAEPPEFKAECERLVREASERTYRLQRETPLPKLPYRIRHGVATHLGVHGVLFHTDVYYVEQATVKVWPSPWVSLFGNSEFKFEGLKEWLSRANEDVCNIEWLSISPVCGFATLKDAEDYLDAFVNHEKHLTYYDDLARRAGDAEPK